MDPRAAWQIPGRTEPKRRGSGVTELPQRLVTGIDPSARTAQLANGETLPHDLFVGIPKHRAPDPLETERYRAQFALARDERHHDARDGVRRPPVNPGVRGVV